MKKRFLALLLVAVMLVSFIPATALAAETETEEPSFTMVNMTLSGVLKVNFKVSSNGADMSAYSVRVTLGEDSQDITKYTREGELYVYTADLPAHRMHEEMTVQLFSGDTAVGEEKIFTVSDHVDALKELYAGDEELAAMLDAMVDYGTYAAYYADPTGTAPAASAVEAVEQSAMEKYQMQITQMANLGAAAALYIDDACDIRVKFDAEKMGENKLLVDGQEVELTAEDTKLVYTIEELLPQTWSKLYSFQVVDADGNAIMAFNYGVLSYAYAVLSQSAEAQTGLNGLLKAMYLYHTATATYAAANDMDTYVVTPNSTRFLYKDGKSDGYRFIFDTTNTDIKKAVDFINTQFYALAGNKIDYPGTVDQVSWNADSKYIVVGNRTMFAAAGLEMPAADLGDTGYYIVTKGNSVFIMAQEGADEAQAYQLAALAFLKAVVGYEMYAEDCVSYTVADGKNFTMPDMKIIGKPDVDYRNEGNYVSVGTGSYGMGYTDTNIFIPINGNVYHTALDLLNPVEYYGDHTDWFFLEKQAANWWESILGTEKYQHYQLCYGTILNDTQAQDIIYNNLKAAAVANPGVNNISFGPADNNYICTCDTCSSIGAVSAYVQVANLMAERLAADPEVTQDVKLVVFAYRQYKNAPAGVTAHKNVGVMVAPIEASYNTPIADQAECADNIKAWANISNHLYIWYYQANFDNYLYPMDSWDVMQSNIQFARDNGADFIFYQNQGKTASHFSKLKDYLEAELTKNADADYNTLVNNFFANYFGPAAASMRQYFDALQAHMNASGSTGAYKEAINTTAFWPQAKLQEFMGYINAAYEAVEADGAANAYVYNSRIKLESLFPRFALLSLYTDTTTAGTVNNFAIDCTALGVTNYNEMTAWADSDYSGWWSHTCSSWSEYAHDRCLVSGATEQSGAIYYKTCSACGAIGTETFVSGSPLNHDAHTYTFTAGEDENAGYDVGTCVCGETVLVKTDYSASDPVDVVNGTATTLTMPEGFAGTITQVKFGETATCAVTDGTLDTTSIPTMNHGLWTSVDVTFTSEYGGTHTAQVPVTLITDVIDDVTELTAFAATAMAANSNSQLLYGYYILGADIDCDGASIATGGGAWNGYGFMGTLDGRDHKISNMQANNQGGIFGRMGANSAVKNIHFKDVAFAANTALFAKITDRAVFTNVTVDIASWVSVSTNMTYAGILGVSSNPNNTFKNFVINVAKGVSVSNLMGAQFSGTGDITVNLHGDAAIVNYYTDASGNAVTSAEGTIITVNTIAYNDYTVDTAMCTESGTALVLTNEAFTDGETATVTVGGGTAQTVIVSGNSITVNTDDAAAGQKNDVVITIGTNTWTYNNVFFVTQIIDTAAEMTAFTQLSAGADYTGYYILGADINMNGAEIGATEGWYAGFTGTFDGCGYTVSNFTVTTRGGIFGAIKSATIQNVTFDAVKYTYNTATYGAALLGRTGSGNAVLKNVAVHIASWHNGGNVNGGALFASATENVTFTNVDVTLAENLAITTNFFGIGYNESNVAGDITVTLNEGSSITNWYKNTAGTVITELPEGSIITMISLAIIETTEDTFVVAENSTTLTLSNAVFTSGVEATVTLGQSNTTATADDGTLSVDLSALGVSVMGELDEDLVVTCNRNRITYTNVWYVTQVINDADELRALGLSCQAGYMDGYYILGNDIDCSTYATMNVDPGWGGNNGLSGTFDGRGYEISNIKIVWTSSAASENGVGGLFSRLYGATVKNTVFNVSNLGGNGSLLARFALKSDTSDVILENLTVNLSAYASNAEAVFIGYSMYNTQFNGVTLNVADGVTIGNLFTKNGYNGNSGTGLTVNLGTESTITSYYGDSAENAKPDFVTVNSSDRAKVTETLDTLVAGEAATDVSFTHSVLSACTTADVTINGTTQADVAIAGGAIAVDLADYGVSDMGQYSAVITTDYGDVLTYTQVWYVTQVIDDVAELKALGTLCKDNIVTGYYILGGDIDCSAEATMSNGSGSTTTNGFAGIFNGRDKTISNIKMTWDSATSGLGGLFGKLLGCTIQNTTFDNVNLGTNGTLLASGADKNSTTNANTSLQNLTINLTGYSTSYGVVVGYSMFNTVGSGITINVADGLTVASLMARDNCNSIAYISATVNLGSGSTITNYYSGATTEPDTFTVNTQ